MKFGPFSDSDLRRILDCCQEHAVPCETSVETDQLQVTDAAIKDRVFQTGSSVVHLPHFVEISELDLVKLGNGLEDIGIGTSVLFGRPLKEETAFSCPRCSHSSDKKGQCPRHALALLTFDEYVVWKRNSRERLTRRFVLLFLFILFGMYAAKRYYDDRHPDAPLILPRIDSGFGH